MQLIWKYRRLVQWTKSQINTQIYNKKKTFVKNYANIFCETLGGQNVI